MCTFFGEECMYEVYVCTVLSLIRAPAKIHSVELGFWAFKRWFRFENRTSIKGGIETFVFFVKYVRGGGPRNFTFRPPHQDLKWNSPYYGGALIRDNTVCKVLFHITGISHLINKGADFNTHYMWETASTLIQSITDNKTSITRILQCITRKETWLSCSATM